MVKCVRWLAVLTLAGFLAGCNGDYGPVIAANPDPSPQTQAYASLPRAIQTGDRIKVTVYGEDSLNGVYDVDPSGNLSLPLAGTIRAAGLTRSELQRAITTRYRKSYLQDPQVSVEVASYQPFYVMGEVTTPGAYPYKGPVNVLRAIAMAGGMTFRGSRSSVLIQHPGSNAWTEYHLTPSVMVEPGDLIRVPERYF